MGHHRPVLTRARHASQTSTDPVLVAGIVPARVTDWYWPRICCRWRAWMTHLWCYKWGKCIFDSNFGSFLLFAYLSIHLYQSHTYMKCIYTGVYTVYNKCRIYRIYTVYRHVSNFFVYIHAYNKPLTFGSYIYMCMVRRFSYAFCHVYIRYM